MMVSNLPMLIGIVSDFFLSILKLHRLMSQKKIAMRVSIEGDKFFRLQRLSAD